MKTDLTLPLPAEAFIPHRPPMRLVERLISYDDGAGVIESILDKDSLLVDGDGTIDAVALVELMAQGYAVIKGYDDLLQGKEISEGYLVGVRKLRIIAQAHAGEPLRIHIRTIGCFEGFAVAEGEVSTPTGTIASGTLKLWIVGTGGTA